jgi:hypothetical protein
MHVSFGGVVWLLELCLQGLLGSQGHDADGWLGGIPHITAHWYTFPHIAARISVLKAAGCYTAAVH